ncbi:outer membrane protein, partial [Phenylobacterium aquaticum]|uniref:outer membrane protein n=1 Tax=Phenylobacterium aquaticum TaxID=1763816 RepID=UPI001F5DEE35
MKFKLLAGAALAAVFAASGAAAQEPGWYGAVDLGYHTPEGAEMTSSNNSASGAPYNWDLTQKDDWAGFARLGYQLNDHWRVELEGGYRAGDVQSFRGSSSQAIIGLCTPGVLRTAASPNCGAPSGSMASWTVMGNVIYDILPDSAINPFIGAGVGVNHLKADSVVGQFSNVTGTISAANPGIQNLTVNDDDTSFAWQLLGGLAWKATDRLNVDVTYRYLSGADMTLASTGTAALQPGSWSGKYSDQSVTWACAIPSLRRRPRPPPPR